MHSLRLRNLRSIVDSGDLELRRITLLVGKNSSGKSTYLRALPLIKQSVRTRSTSPILWYGDYVDFGSFNEVHTKARQDEPISFGFGFQKLRVRVSGTYEYRSQIRIIGSAYSEVNLGESDGLTKLRSYRVVVDEDELYFELDSRGAVSSLLVNGKDHTAFARRLSPKVNASEAVPQISFLGTKNDRVLLAGRRGAEVAEQEISRFLRPYMGYRMADTTLLRMVRRVRYAPLARFSESMSKSRSDLVTWNQFIHQVTSWNRGLLVDLHAMYFIMTLPEITYQLARRMHTTAQSIAYIGPVRATGERYYRFQELGVEQIDPQGRNLAMYLNSLSKPAFQNFSRWLHTSLGYEIDIERSRGHVQILLKEESSSEWFNVADMGYGFSQVLPVLAQIWSSGRRAPPFSGYPIIAIEQPELHLHPAYQARLANLFASIATEAQEEEEAEDDDEDHIDVDAAEPDMKLIIETHSEAMINRFGELIAEGRLKPSDIAVYRFEKDELNDVSNVCVSRFLQDGTLDSWPIGFFASDAEF
jgi:predicted ATPase